MPSAPFLNRFRNFPTNAKLRVLVVASLVCFSLYGLYSLNTVWEVKVDGPYYRDIIRGKDLLADVMPPPAYLVEAYLCAVQMGDSEGEELEREIAAFARHKAAYLERQAYWERTLPEGELRTAFLRDSRAPGLRMLEAVERGLIPALRAGDKAAALRLLHGPVRRDYEEHRSRIDQVTAIAAARHKEEEARAGQAVTSRTWGQALLGLFLIGSLIVASRYVFRFLEERIQSLIGGRKALSAAGRAGGA